MYYEFSYDVSYWGKVRIYCSITKMKSILIEPASSFTNTVAILYASLYRKFSLESLDKIIPPCNGPGYLTEESLTHETFITFQKLEKTYK